MSRSNPNKPNGPKRIDVSSPAKGLTQNPFAELARVTATALPTQTAQTAPKTEPEPKSKSRGRLLLRRETKHRGGKTVVVISGFATLRDRSEQLLGELEKQLKQRLGCGGTIDLDKREILIQGDRPEDIAALLRGLGYEVAGTVSRG